jgi:hypothetical protein
LAALPDLLGHPVLQRSVQRPRLFYRRELEEQPFVVAAPAGNSSPR